MLVLVSLFLSVFESVLAICVFLSLSVSGLRVCMSVSVSIVNGSVVFLSESF